VLQEQQADDDAQDTQHTWRPRCEKAVNRRHHNFSYEGSEACQNSAVMTRLGQRFYNLARGAQGIYRENRQPGVKAKRNGGNGCRQKPHHDLRPKADGTYLVDLGRLRAKGPFASIEYNEQRPHQGGQNADANLSLVQRSRK
jgi:hypothetical protein